jgi:hypothetical protein
VPIGLEVSKADAARIDEVLERPEFAGWSRAEWCVVIIRTALRYYVGDASAAGPGPGRARAAARPAAPQPSRPSPRRETAAPEPAAPEPAAPEPAAPEPAAPQAAAPESAAQPECSHPRDARDYQTGTCAACGAILWD